ncbi:hypothetical protein KI387_001750, partial [Taxus chinensis]
KTWISRKASRRPAKHLGQSGQKYAVDAESPDRPERITFALTTLGHLGQRYANQPNRAKWGTNQSESSWDVGMRGTQK